LIQQTQVLVATLGGQTQIITFTLDLLLSAGFPINEVIVVHPQASHPRLQASLDCLKKEFESDYYSSQGKHILFRSHVLTLANQPIDDITNDTHVDGTLDTLHRLIGELKQQRRQIHLSLSGGRRLMSLLAITVATFNFDRYDHIWHLYTPEALRAEAADGKIMHMPLNAGHRLIQEPFLPLSSYYSYDSNRSFRTLQDEQRLQMDAQEQAKCAEVLEKASPAQRKVLRAFAQGKRPRQIADELKLAVVTIHTHKTALLGLCHNAWNIPTAEHLDYHFLRAKFAGHFTPDN
jgi:CRISPR-associated protein Csx14